ncbi:MAG: GTPase [Pirellulaceae bacterium]
MELDLQRTIVAVSTGLAAAPRAVVRISGAKTADILDAILIPKSPSDRANKVQLLDARRAKSWQLPCEIGWLSRTISAQVYYWPNSRSFTGEPCAELHVLGSLPIVEALVEHICAQGAVPAERGEFTLRSFLAGKIDLTQAEAVLAVIEANATSQLNWALEQLAGNLSRPVRALRDELIELVAHLEAGLDFVEEDIEFISEAALVAALHSILERLERLSQQLRSRGTRCRLPEVVLLGLPNAGKSSLFNALLGHERAIVTNQAGTTRDALSATWQIDQCTVELVDTAGLEELDETSPRGLAQSVVRERLERAAAVLFCVDLGNPPPEAWLDCRLAELRERAVPTLVVGTKADLAEGDIPASITVCVSTSECMSFSDRTPGASISIANLKQRLAKVLKDLEESTHSGAMHRTMIRCQSAIDLARASLERGMAALQGAEGEEFVAAELRYALEDLSSVIGEVHNEDILGEIFSRFCIGK